VSRYLAPADDGGLLIDPPIGDVGRLLESNISRLRSTAIRIADIPLIEFREQAAKEMLAAAGAYLAEGYEPIPPAAPRLLVAGHQPDFFHPGVWVKKFVLHALAKQHGLAPLNLVVDNDTAKSADIHVPIVAEKPDDVKSIALPYDRPAGDQPHEDHRVIDRRLFESIPERLSAHAQNWGFEPLARRIWPMILVELDRGATLGTAVSRVRRSLEREWGVSNFELPVSRLAETQSFARFVFTILVDLPRFRDAYNTAIREYRTKNRLRSRNHPAPELDAKGDWTEAPFWVWRTGQPRRQRLFVRRTGHGLTLHAGEQPIGECASSAGSFLKCWPDIRAQSWKVRPRALTLTLFARVCLGDGFIHGIGGGKYDEVTDTIIRHFFRIEPPGYAVVSATLRLPLRRFPATEATLHAAERRLRDLQWNPQRVPKTREMLPELVFEKERLFENEPSSRVDRRLWFRQLQQLTRDMRPAIAGEIESAERDRSRIRSELAANEVLASREYAWPLFPEEMLRTFFRRIHESTNQIT
jgi:hypothetical protein